MKACRIAILGATGAVGRTMLQVLEEQTDWEIGEVRLLASPRSAGQTLLFKGQPEGITEEMTVAQTIKENVPHKSGENKKQPEGITRDFLAKYGF